MRDVHPGVAHSANAPTGPFDLALTDPTCALPDSAGPSLATSIAERVLDDVRDLPFLRLLAALLLTVVPTGVLLFVPATRSGWLIALHVSLILYFMGPYLLMHHNVAHRRLFTARWRWLEVLSFWILGPFFGESPETYFAHHVGMHHPENNLELDVSSTLPYARDSAVDFARYLASFLCFGLRRLSAYLRRKGRRSLRVRCIGGELALFTLIGGLCFIDWRMTLIVFVAPLVMTRTGAMVANWAQHAFVDPMAPGNIHRNSVTCINSPYNRRCFNDGYHTAHHLEPTRHWTDMPSLLRENLETYRAEGALIFRELDYFQIWACLMLRRYDWLERRFVRLGDDRRPAREIIAMLRDRTRPCRPREWPTVSPRAK